MGNLSSEINYNNHGLGVSRESSSRLGALDEVHMPNDPAPYDNLRTAVLANKDAHEPRSQQGGVIYAPRTAMILPVK